MGLRFFFRPFGSIGEDIPRYAMEGTAVAGQVFATLDLDDFAVLVVPPDLLKSLFIFLCV